MSPLRSDSARRWVPMFVWLSNDIQHFKETEGDAWKKLNLQLPISFCQAKQTRVRFPGDAMRGDSAIWEKLEEDWSSFWSTRGREKLGKSGKAAVNGAHIY